MPDKRQDLFLKLQSMGATVGSFQEFNQKLNDPKKVDELYNKLTSLGADLGTPQEFQDKLKNPKPKEDSSPGFLSLLGGKMNAPVMGSQSVKKGNEGLVDVDAAKSVVNNTTREFLNMISSGGESIFNTSTGAGNRVGTNRIFEGVNQTIQRLSDVSTGALFDPSKKVETPRIPTLPEDDLPSQLARKSQEALFKFGKARKDWMESILPTPEQYKGNFWLEDIPQAFGQVAGFVAGGVILGRGAGIPEWMMSGALGALTEAQGQAQQTYEKTGDLKKADITYAEGLGIGFTEAADTGILFKALKRFASGKVVDKLMVGLTEGIGEFLQESSQTVMENMSDRDLYEANRDMMSGVYRAGGAAFFSGLLLGMMGHSARHRLAQDGISPQSIELMNKLIVEQKNVLKQNEGKIKEGISQIDFFEKQIDQGATPQDALSNISKDLNIRKVEISKPFLALQKTLVTELGVTGDEARNLTHKIGTGALLTAEESQKLIEFKDLKKYQGSLKSLYQNMILDNTMKVHEQTEVYHDGDQTSEKNPEDNSNLEKRAKQDVSLQANVVDRILFGDADPYFQAEAHHGSPFDFNVFDSDKIGTGEGAQSYGYGLYFSSQENIAKYYAENLTNSKVDFESMRTWTDDELKDYVVNIYNIDADRGATQEMWDNVGIAEQIVKDREAGTDVIQPKSNRNLYKVTLWEGKEQNLLDWDSYLIPPTEVETSYTQSEEAMGRSFIMPGDIAGTGHDLLYNYDQFDSGKYWVMTDDIATRKESLKEITKEEFEEAEQKFIASLSKNSDLRIIQLIREQAKKENIYVNISPGVTGADLYRSLVGEGEMSPKEVSAFLNRAGVDGIVYIGNESGVKNYVVFDDKAITIKEKTYFQQDNSNNPIATDSYASLIDNQQPAARELANDIFAKGAINPQLTPVLKWLLDNANADIRYVNNNTLVKSNGQTFGQIGAKGAFVKIKGRNTIGINLDARYKNKTDLGDTLAHELWHSISVDKLETDLQFRADITNLLNHVKNNLPDKFYQNNKAHLDTVLASPEEFLANVMGNTSPLLREWMANNKMSDGRGYLRRFVDALLELFKRLTGGDATYLNAMEITLNKHYRTTIFSTRISQSDIVIPEDDLAQQQADMNDKIMMITEEGLENPRVILNTAKILADQEGLKPSDFYQYFKSLSKVQLSSRLDQSDEWIKKAEYHYNKYYKDKFASFDQYKATIITNLYNYAQVLRNVTKARLNISTERDFYGDEHPIVTAKLTQLGNDYTDKTGKHQTSYTRDIKMYEILDQLQTILGTELEIVWIDEVQKTNITAGITGKTISTSIAEDRVFDDSRNHYYAEILEQQGYLFPGTWADKNTVLAFKVKDNVNQAAFDALNKMYQSKAIELVQALFAKRKGQDTLKAVQKKAAAEKKSILEYIDDDLREYAQPVSMNSQILRAVIEDIRLGGRMINGQFQTALFDPDIKDSYDAIRIFKRPYLVSPMSYVDQSGDIKTMLANLPNKRHGMSLRNGKLQTNAVVFDANPQLEDRVNESEETIVFKYKGRNIDIRKMLVNKFRTERTDGQILYVKGGFEKIWHQLHGTLKDGAIKAWISNSFGDQFNSPFYVKGAYHMISEDDPIGQWMMENNITLLISSSAAKVNSYPLSNLFSSASSFEIPFSEIQRNNEKGSAKDGGRGLMQSLTTNYITKENPYFVDKGWSNAIKDIINYSTRTFNEAMLALTPGKVVEYLKDQAIKGGSDFQKTIGALVIELAYTKADKKYADYKKTVDIADPLQRNILKTLRRGKVLTDDKIAKQIGKFFNDPYFAKGPNDYIKKMLNAVTSFKIPASWGVLGGDLGFMASSRTDQIERQAEDNYSYRRAKEYMEQGRERFKNISEIIQQRLDEKETLLAAAMNEKDMKLAARQTELVEMINQEINDLSDELEKYDENGLPDTTSDEYKAFVDPKSETAQKEIQKFILGAIDPETGMLNFGYTMISQDIAELYGLKAGDRITHLAVPSDSMMSAGGSVIAAVLSPEIMEPNKIILNSEYIQSMVGKDFDIDTLLIIPKSEAFTDLGFDGFYDTLNASIESHKKKMATLYRSELQGHKFNLADENGRPVIKSASELDYGDILQKEVRLAFTQKFNGKSELTRDLFNPLSDSMTLLDEYQKQIGKIVNVRKMFTLKTQIGFKSKIGNMAVNPAKTARAIVYNLFLNMTNDMVDVPTNTNKFFYKYEFLKIMDYINGTNFYSLYQKFIALEDEAKADMVMNTAVAVDTVDKYLFERGIRADTDNNLEDYNETVELSDTLGYIKQQQQINHLIKTGQKAILFRDYGQWLLNRDKSLVNPANIVKYSQIINAAKKYIRNMQVEDLDQSPALKSADLVTINNIPSVGMTEEEYVQTQVRLVQSLFKLDGFKKYKEIFDQAGIDYSDIMHNITKGKFEFEGVDNNRQAVQLFLMTANNKDLHWLKAKVISLINPIDQTLVAPDSPKIKNFYDSIFQKTNAETYPTLIKLMFENTKAFNWNTQRKHSADEVTFKSDIGDITFSKGEEETLLVTYKGKTISSKELAARNNPNANRVKGVIYGSLFGPSETKEGKSRSAENRVKLSNLMPLGSTNIPINLRIAAAAELLNNELPKFSNEDQGTFWVSLMGKPSANLNGRLEGKGAKAANPTNLVLPYGGNATSYSSQDRLYHLLSLMPQPVGKRFLQRYVEAFDDNYTGKDFHDSYQVEQLQRSTAIFSDGKDDRVWFHSVEQKEWREEDPKWVDQFKTMQAIIRNEKVIPGTATRTEPVAQIVDFTTGRIQSIGVKEVMNATSAYVTRLSHDFGHALVAFTKILHDTISVNQIDNMETTRDNKINTLLVDIRTDNKPKVPLDSMKNVVKHLKHYNLAPDLEKIHEIVEQNKLGISSITQDVIGYKIIRKGISYNDQNELEALFEDAEVPEKEYKHYEIALEYMKRYAVDNVNHIQYMVDYLHSFVDHLIGDFGKMNEINAMIYKYEQLLAQMQSHGVTYIPHVFTQQIVRKEFMAQERKSIEAYVKEKIKDEKLKHQKGNDLADPEYYNATTEDQYRQIVEKLVNQRFVNISFDNLGDYVHSFQLSRNPIPSKDYIMDSNIIHQYHQRLFQNMLLNDLTLVNMMQYESRAHKTGESLETINAVKDWFKLISNHRLIQSEGIKKTEAKAGDHVWFYTLKKTKNGYKEVNVRGVVASNENGVIKLLTDMKTLKDQLKYEMERVNKEHDQIIKLPPAKPTTDQMTTFKKLLDAGYTTKPSKYTMETINSQIYVGYQNMLKDSDNWGKYRYEDIYGKQYEAGTLQNKDTIMREPQRSSKDEIWNLAHLLTSATFLAGPAAGTTNWLDAQAGLIMDFRGWRYFKFMFYDNIKPQKTMDIGAYRKRLRERMTTGDYAYYDKAWNKAYKETIDQLTGNVTYRFNKNIGLSDKIKLAETFAKEYALSANLHKIERFSEMVINEPTIESGATGKIQEGVKTVANSYVGTKIFNKAEIRVRTTAAFLYAYKAIVEDNLTDPKEIEWAISKGIARSQSLYENMYRKLREKTSKGKFLSLFSQYMTYQKDVVVAEWDQAHIQKLKFTDLFHPTATIDGKVYRANDTVDPNIYNRWAVKMCMDMVYFSLGNLIPGMRQRSPIGRLATAPLAFLAQALVTGHSPSEWDLRDWLFSFLSIWIGLGNTLPIQFMAAVANNYLGIHIPLISDEKKTGKGQATVKDITSTFFPSSPREGRAIKALYESFAAEPPEDGSWAKEMLFGTSLFERNVMGFNFFIPTQRTYYTKMQNEFQQDNPAKKILDLIEMFPEVAIPPFNLVDPTRGSENKSWKNSYVP